jgi:hypothetical protein
VKHPVLARMYCRSHTCFVVWRSALRESNSLTVHTDHGYQQNGVSFSARQVQQRLAFRSYQGGEILTSLNYIDKVYWKQMLEATKLSQCKYHHIAWNWPSTGRRRPGYVSGHLHVTWLTWHSCYVLTCTCFLVDACLLPFVKFYVRNTLESSAVISG